MKKHVLLFIISLCYFSQISFSQNCPAPSAHTNFSTNNINAKISNGGYLFRDSGGNYGAFQVPYVDSGSPTTIFAAGLWLGGYSGWPNNPSLKLSAETYDSGGNGGYLAGPLSDVGTMFTSTSCEDFNKIWTITKTEIQTHILDYEDNGVIDNPNPNIVGFPCKGNPNFLAENGFELPNSADGLTGYHPYFFDRNGDNIYDAMDGDYPSPIGGGKIIPSQLSWAVFNDLGQGIGDVARYEIHLTAWTFECPLAPILDNTLFTNYRIYNKSQVPIDSLSVGMWVDFDLGCYTDDYVGCNPDLNTFYAYNQDQVDGETNGGCQGGVPTYGTTPPVQAVTFLDQELEHFTSYGNGGIGAPPPGTTDPNIPAEFFNYLTGSWRDGTPFTQGGSGYNPGSTDLVNHLFPDDPNDSNGWSLESIGAATGDFRALGTTGEFYFGNPNGEYSFQYGDKVDMTLAWTFHQGDGLGRLQNVSLMFDEVAELKNWWDNFNNEMDPCSLISSDEKIDFGKNISLYPNPNNGTFQLDFFNEKLSNVQVFDVSGKLVWERKEKLEDSVTIQLQNVSSGIYFLKGNTEGGVFYKKIVVGE